MKQTRVAKRYAQALMDLAEETKTVDQVVHDLQFLQTMVNQAREFVLFLKSPVIKKEKKREILHELLGQNLSSVTLSFVDLLAQKGREDIIDQIIEQFFVLYDQHMGIVPVDVKVAVELDSDLRRTIEERFVRLIKKKVRMMVHVDRGIRGGFVARVGDTVFDGSVRRQLELLREQFVESASHT